MQILFHIGHHLYLNLFPCVGVVCISTQSEPYRMKEYIDIAFVESPMPFWHGFDGFDGSSIYHIAIVGSAVTSALVNMIAWTLSQF